MSPSVALEDRTRPERRTRSVASARWRYQSGFRQRARALRVGGKEERLKPSQFIPVSSKTFSGSFQRFFFQKKIEKMKFSFYKAIKYIGCPTSHGKFFFLSPYLPVPALEVPCHVVNSSSHLPTCQFRPWKSHVMW